MNEQFYETVSQMLDNTNSVYEELLELYKEKISGKNYQFVTNKNLAVNKHHPIILLPGFLCNYGDATHYRKIIGSVTISD